MKVRRVGGGEQKIHQRLFFPRLRSRVRAGDPVQPSTSIPHLIENPTPISDPPPDGGKPSRDPFQFPSGLIVDGLILVLPEPGGDLDGRMTRSWGWELAEPDGRLCYIQGKTVYRSSRVSCEALRSAEKQVQKILLDEDLPSSSPFSFPWLFSVDRCSA